jgi:hypothetical protein
MNPPIPIIIAPTMKSRSTKLLIPPYLSDTVRRDATTAMNAIII